jgi:hypothetical protein
VLTASKDLYDYVKLSWNEIPLAENYIIYKGTGNLFSSATELKRVASALTCEDAAAPGILYYYWIKSNNDDATMTSLASAAVQGRALGTNTAITNGDTTSGISGSKDACVYYSISVTDEKTRLIATLGNTSSAILNDCDIYAKFGSRPTIASYNAKGVESILGETLTVTKPAIGTWYFMLYGVTEYNNVTLTVNYYSVTDIVLTQVPVNDLPVPFTANFKGRVVDETGATGIADISIKARNPITGITSLLPAKTDATGYFTYSTTINTEGEHTFDFFFTTMPDNAKGTASHTVATRKGCFENNNFFDFSAYLPATPVALPLQNDIVGLQTFLNIRNGWDFLGTVNAGDTYETLWINSTMVKAENDSQLLDKLDEGLYMYFYGVEGAGIGNDTTTTSQLSTVPFVVHVEAATKKDGVLTALKSAGIIDDTQELAINGGKIGIVAIAALSSPDEVTDGYNISLLAREQLEILAILAGWNKGPLGITDVKYTDVPAKQIMITLANGKRINVVAAGFVK